MRVLRVVLLLALLGGCGASGSASTDDVVTVRVAAASDLQGALAQVQQALEEQAPDLRLSVTYGSSGTFHQQLTNGAPFDLFLSADLAYPRNLVEAGLAEDADLFEYGVGRLALWAPTSSPIDPSAGLEVLLDPAVDRVAIANPRHAPYGVAALAAMRSAGVDEAVADQLVLGENVAQASEFVRSGNADVGIIALSLALAPEMAKEGRWAEVPLDSYPRLRQGGVVPTAAREAEAARRVRDVLLSPEGRAILARHGFLEPGA